MLYPRRDEPLTKEEFQNPRSEYRATPFWAWNTSLDKDELVWQIEQLKRMGYGGFHMHVRTGMATPYLSDEYMDLIGTCVEKAREESMLAWLYDEDRWPSGAAGGFVTKNPEHRIRHLLLTRTPYREEGSEKVSASNAIGRRTENGELIAIFDVELDKSGHLIDYKKINEEDRAKGFKLYAYMETALSDPWYNNQTYANTLDKSTIQEFIRVTYERYKGYFQKDFGGVVPAIFTDEPQFSSKETLDFAHDSKDITLPWTSDLPDTYSQTYGGESLVDNLPQLLWELPDGKISVVRYHYHDHIAERFASAFADQCGEWCRDHGLMLTGHMMEEPTLLSQTHALGEAMRSYRSFDLPGIDMLCDRREFTTAKQAQSASRQYGCPGVLSELYGVTNWDFDFRGHKLQGDWQAALGVTVRVPHLSWVSMNGEAKRDYPASMNYQAPWYKQYSYIEDHFARIASAMTRGKAICRVGVVHPIESYWLHWGDKENTLDIREQKDKDFQDLCDWLLRGQIDFDYICESTLPQQCDKSTITGESLPVGDMNYNVVIVPAMETIRKTTLERLKAFQNAGGCLVFLGEPPKYVDAYEDDGPRKLWKDSVQLPFDRLVILDALTKIRDLEIHDSQGEMVNNLLYQLRGEEDCRWLFIAQADKMENKDQPKGDILRIRIRGEWAVTIYDTISGSINAIPVQHENGWTVIRYALYEHDSLLLRLDHSIPLLSGKSPKLLTGSNLLACRQYLDPVSVTLHEPNVLLLDMAEYALDDGEWQPREEILRLDNEVRTKLGWPLRGGQVVQPWVENDTTTPHTLGLRYTFHSEIATEGSELALENAENTRVTLNGSSAGEVNGWYVDKCIEKVSLPEIQVGENILELTIPYGRKTDVEAIYLLGDFGVKVQGIHCTLTKPIDRLCFGDITTQGLPFYGGNLTYHLEAESYNGMLDIGVTNYRGHLLRVEVDGEDKGVIAFSPYRLLVEGLSNGVHRVDLKYFGSRINTFGQLHHVSRADGIWWGPYSWRSTGSDWTYEYKFWPQGVLKSPEIV